MGILTVGGINILIQPGDLTRDGCLRSWLLLPPQGNEHSDVPQPFVPEPVHCQLEALARKHLLVAMATKTQKPGSTKKQLLLLCFCARYAHTHLFSLFQEVDGVARHV